MENNLINIDLAQTLEISQSKAEQLNALAITAENCLTLEGLRTDNNKEIKAYKAQIEEAKKRYLEPFAIAEKQALEAIKPFEEANKDFSAKILEAKKLRRDNELREHYTDLLSMATSESGEIPSWFPTFDKANEGISYSVTLTIAKQVLKAHIEDCKATTTNVILKGSRANVEKVKSFAIGLGVEWGEF